MKRRTLFIVAAVAAIVLIILVVVRVSMNGSTIDIDAIEMEIEPNLLFGIDVDQYQIESGVIASGETLSVIFNRYGLSSLATHNAGIAAEPIFKMSSIRADKPYTVFMSRDSLSRLCHFVYEKDLTEYITFSFESDTILVSQGVKDVILNRSMGSGVITSSLWNSMVENDMPPALAMELSEIFAWSVDFFGIQSGDSYSVIYDQKYVDTTRIGTGTIYGAWFDHMNKRYYAIPFYQDDKLSYWDQDGNSLRQQFLKAPLKYTRISSGFSNGRLHPVLKIVRPHHGVDYAAPSGTPVFAVADGTISYRGWTNGGGNTIKIKHARQLETSYMHLRAFADGITSGKRVSQGDLIGYVGSTGLSTGPHLDFRVYKNGVAINPLTMTSEPSEPISEQSREKFNAIRDRIMAEFEGEVADSVKVTLIDIQ